MKMCTETITLYVPYLNSNGLDTYRQIIIHGVSWFHQNLSGVTDSGLKSDDQVTVRIPAEVMNMEYVDYAKYKTLSDTSGNWTLCEGMSVVHGEVESENKSPAALIAAYGRERVKTVLSFTDNRRGQAPHFKVVCK